MDKNQLLQIVKARLGISKTVRDPYLLFIINAVIDELEKEKGVFLNPQDFNHMSLIVDYAVWRYQNKEKEGGLPRHLQFRIHNLMISSLGEME